MKCSYGWFKRWSQRFKIRLRYSHDDLLLEWVLARFDRNEGVTLQELQRFGLGLIRKEEPGFKASSGWAMRWGSVCETALLNWSTVFNDIFHFRFCRRHRHLLNPDDAFDLTYGGKEEEEEEDHSALSALPPGEMSGEEPDAEGENASVGVSSSTRYRDPPISSSSDALQEHRRLKLPEMLEERSDAFLKSLPGLGPFPRSRIVAMVKLMQTSRNICFIYPFLIQDELALHFGAASQSAIAPNPRRPTPTTLLRQASSAQADAALFLAATAEGDLLPPFLVFRVRRR